MDILYGYAVTGVVVPYGEHTAKDGGVVFLEFLIADGSRCPIVIKVLAVEVVIVITGCRHDVDETVGDADELVALFFHFLRVGVAIVPAAHDDVF